MLNCFARRIPAVLAMTMVWLLIGCGTPDYRDTQGQTMGTYYAVRAGIAPGCDISQAQLEAVLAEVNAVMSTYLADSELSRINTAPTEEWQTLSPQLAHVMDAAYQLWRRSAGAFDVTVGPLVNVWGFGPEAGSEPPSLEQQASAQAMVGMQHVQLHDGQLAKLRPGVYIDLSALAKGYGVDRLAEAYLAADCSDFMVDIGGEIRVSGLSPRGSPWRIGIEVPDPSAIGVSRTVLALSDISVATSGDYRNFRMVDGVRVDHVIDPRSGAPADNRVVSATVLHPSAMWADAYATALMVMELEEGMAFAEREGIAVYLMAHAEDGVGAVGQTNAQLRLESRYNARMARYLQP